MIYIKVKGKNKQPLNQKRDSQFKQEWYESQKDYIFTSEEDSVIEYEKALSFCDSRLNHPGWEEDPQVERYFDYIMQFEQQTMGFIKTMKTPTPDFNKDTVSRYDIFNWVNEGFVVKPVGPLKEGVRYGSYWDGKCIVVYEVGELKAE